ncbi:MAG: PepSY domain-containing protein [Rhodanobacteraceae bacterium]
MKSRIIAAVLAGALSISAVNAAAPPPRAHPSPAVHPASLEQAVKQVQRETGGHILAADTVSRGRTQVYRIKVLKPGGKVQVLQLHSDSKPQARSNQTAADHGGY